MHDHMSSPNQQHLIFAGKQLKERGEECPDVTTCPPMTNSASSLLESSSRRGGGEVHRCGHISSPDQQCLIFAGKQLEERRGEKCTGVTVCPLRTNSTSSSLASSSRTGSVHARPTLPHLCRQAARGGMPLHVLSCPPMLHLRLQAARGEGCVWVGVNHWENRTVCHLGIHLGNHIN